MVQGPDRQELLAELSDDISAVQNALDDELSDDLSIVQDSQNTDNGVISSKDEEEKEDIYAGPQTWHITWHGPFFSENIPKNCTSGLYLIYVGNYPIFISSSANILLAMTRHIMFSGRQVIPIDLLGREMLHYSTTYHQPINIKTGVIYHDNTLIEPAKSIQCYRRAAAAIAYCHAIPCNKYASASYGFDPLTIINQGRFFPLKSSFHAESDPTE